MNHQLQRKRALICTFVALVSGVFSSYIGGQISLKTHSHNCQRQPWGFLEAVCTVWVTPEAVWHGSSTGLWLGSVLGAFVSGLATRKTFEEDEVSAEQTLTSAVNLCADDLELTPAQREALRRFFVLLVIQLSRSSQSTLSSETEMSLSELQRLAELAGLKNTNQSPSLTLAELRCLFGKLGFSNRKP